MPLIRGALNSIQLDKHGHPDGESSIVFCLKSNGKFDFEERQALLFKDYEYEIKREVYDGLIEYLMEYVKKWKEIYSAPILDGLSWELRIGINHSDIVRSQGHNKYPTNYEFIVKYIQEFMRKNANEFKSKRKRKMFDVSTE